jgi:hypothetical protein
MRGCAMNGNDVPLVCAIRGPVTLITVGGLFALNNFTPYGIEKTWPVILIVFGLLSLLRRGAAPAAAPRPDYPYNFPPAPGPYAPPSPAPQRVEYNAPPASPDRGGFGTSAPARPAPPTEQGGSI